MTSVDNSENNSAPLGKLILLRHGQSTWNAENLFTGWWDADLSEKGRAEATAADNWNRYLRSVAEMENVRKRATRDIEAARRAGVEKLATELLAIAERMLTQQNYHFGEGARAAFAEYLTRRIAQPHFANARSVRNALDRIRLRQASRLFAEQVGATPDQVARSRRAHFARRLLDDTTLRDETTSAAREYCHANSCRRSAERHLALWESLR